MSTLLVGSGILIMLLVGGSLMNLTLFKTKFLMKINYASGISQTAWFHSFEKSGGEWKWKVVSIHNNPLIMNVDEIESVWTMRVKRSVWSLFST